MTLKYSVPFSATQTVDRADKKYKEKRQTKDNRGYVWLTRRLTQM